MGEYIDYLRGYATPRDDSAYTGLNADFGRRLMTMLQAAPEHVRRPDLIESLARDDAAQRRAINSLAQRLYGRPASIMEYTRGIPGYAAPVGGSQHQSGHAADLNWSRLSPEGRDWLRLNAGAYGLRFPLPDTDAGHLEYDANWQGTLPNAQRASVSRLPVEPPPIMNSALMGLSASRSKPETSMPPIFSQAMRGFRDGGAVEAALRIAARQTDRNPTDAQKEVGNYQKGKVRIHGLEIAIENPKGSTRSGTDKDGKSWRCVLPAHYGDIKRSEGADGDAVDCYIGDQHDADKVYIVDQIDAKTGRFDEHKVMVSYPNKAAAVADYRKAFSDGKADARIGAVSEMSVAEFKDWVKSPASRKPVGQFANGGTVMPSTRRNPAVALALDVARRQKRADGGPVASEPLANPSDLLKYPRAFGAGLVDPMGVTGYAARGVAHVAPSALSPEAARAFADRMAGYRAESPVAAGMATMLLPGMGALRLAGMTAREALATAPHWATLGGVGGNVYDGIANGVAGRPGFGEFSGVYDQGGRDLARHYMDVTRDRTSADLQPLPGAPYAGGGRVGYADDGEPLVPGGLPPLPEEMFIRTPVNTLTGAEEGLEARQPIPEMNRNPADYTRALALALADPMQLPSAVTGAFSPETRDAWRAGYQGREESIDAASALTPWGTLTRGATAAATAVPRAFAALPRPAQAVAAGAGALTALPPEATPQSTADGLTPDLRSRRDALQRKQNGEKDARGRVISPPTQLLRAEREELNSINQMTAEFLKMRGAAQFEQERREQETAGAERARQVREAVEARDKIRSDAPRPFSEEYPRLNAFMPFAPAVAGVATGMVMPAARAWAENRALAGWRGALRRANTTTSDRVRSQLSTEASAINESWPKASGMDKFMSYATPMGLSAVEGAALTNLPYAYNSIQLPETNPERTAQQEYYRRLPDDHPDRARTLELLNNEAVLPHDNPAMRTAPPPSLSRSLAGAAEAAGAAILPTTLVNTLRPYERSLPRAQTTALEREIANRRPPSAPSSGTPPPALPELPTQPPAAPAALSPVPPLSGPQSRTSISASERPPHHSHLQPRVSGQFSGPPKKPKKPRRDPEAEATDHHNNPERLTRGQKNGGFVSSALEIARRYMGGRVGYQHGGSVAVGPILGPTGGREDAKPVDVESGSYVLPADFVSSLGTGNTAAGHEMIEQVFGKSDPARATGGPVPIRISDGEHVLTREQVERTGGGDYAQGCRILDALVKKRRAETIQTLKGLPGPAKG